LFIHYGFDKTTVSDIAREAGVSKGAIYLHWKSKDELFEALIFRESQGIVEDMLKRLENEPEAGSIFSLYQMGIVTIIENPLMHAVMTQNVRVMGDFMRRWALANGGQAAEAQLFRDDMVRQLQAAHVIRADLDANVISYIMALIRYGFMTVHEVIAADQTPPLDEVGKTLGMLLERALAPDDGPNKAAGKQVLEKTLHALQELVQQMRRKRGIE
jgi:AcrR family transcriptional regulator